MAEQSFIVATYDIVDDKRRNRVLKAMKNFGPRVQKSVFEFHLDPDRFNQMKKICKRLIDLKKDSIRFYIICESCRKKTKILAFLASSKKN